MCVRVAVILCLYTNERPGLPQPEERSYLRAPLGARKKPPLGEPSEGGWNYQRSFSSSCCARDTDATMSISES